MATHSSGRGNHHQKSDGETLIKDQEGLQKRWAEHFRHLLNRTSTVDHAALSQIPQQLVKNELTLPPSMEEIRKAIFQTNSGRASGKDGIPAEIYKVAGPSILEAFQDILLCIWNEEEMPDDFRDALIGMETTGASLSCPLLARSSPE